MADELDAGLVERLLTAIGDKLGTPCADVPNDKRAEAREIAIAGLRSLPIPVAALNALARGEAVVVPKERTLDMMRARKIVFGSTDIEADMKRIARLREIGAVSKQDREWSAMLAASPYRQADATNVNQ